MKIYRYILDEFFSEVTLLGTPVFYVLAILILVKFHPPLALKLFLTILFIEFLCIAIKLIYRKERPIIQSRDGLFGKIDASSFPSVHSARISLLVVMFGMYFKDVWVFVVGTAAVVGVGWSRIYLKKHDHKDVLFGLLVGAATAIGVFYL